MLNKKKIGIIMFCLVFFTQTTSAAHYITGYVEDALDGESANGKTVTLWNYATGHGTNITDIIGVTGNAGYGNVYLIDCEMMSGGCAGGDILSVKIFGDRYMTNTVNVTVSFAGYDLADNLTLNSPPTAFLNDPADNGNSSADVEFNCSYNDHDENIARVALWGNWLGGWQEIDSQNLGPNSGTAIFSKTLAQGIYEWNCFVTDIFGISDFSFSNNSFFVDTTDPVISEVTSVGSVCGLDSSVPINCRITDNLAVGEVIIQVTSPSNVLSNHSATFLSGDIYRANVNMDEANDWSFECFGFDRVGNMDYLAGDSVHVGSLNAEVNFVGGITFEKTPSIEGEVLNLSVNVSNVGCAGSGNFIVGFFNNGVNFANETAFVGVSGFLEVISAWTVDIGTSNILVIADLENVLNEDNESNNDVTGLAYIKSWQTIFGNLRIDKILSGGGTNIGLWEDESSFNGNVFIADKEAQIEWTSLQAIGRTKINTISNNDFSEIDNFLEMGSYNDSIYDLFTNSGTPKATNNLNVFKKDISNIAIINSSSGGNFKTGILWDMSDSVDSEYDSSEGEDIVFVTQINRGSIGEFGVYDYEIDVPAKLRSYNSEEASEIYLYYDLN